MKYNAQRAVLTSLNLFVQVFTPEEDRPRLAETPQ